MKKLHPVVAVESNLASYQAPKEQKFMKETRKECCLLKGPPACLNRSKARRYSTLLEGSGKEETGVPSFSMEPTFGPCLIRCNARRFSSTVASPLPPTDNLSADMPSCRRLQLFSKRLLRILCRTNSSKLEIKQDTPCKNGKD